MAAKQLAPVTPEVVAWAVREDGRQVDALAAAAKVTPDALQAWIDGQDQPSRGELTRLAEALRRPRSLFLLPKPPVSMALPTSFRHPAGNRRADVGAQARLYIRSARRIQRAVAWAERSRNSSTASLPRSDVQAPAEAVAATVRTWLSVPVAEQVAWGSEYNALANWRAAVEDKGLLTFQFEIPGDQLRGFSAWDDYAPMVAINLVGQSPQARIFTLAHEIGHLVTRTDAACLDWVAPRRRQSSSIEGWCDDFGAALLVPRDDVTGFAARELNLRAPRAKADLAAAQKVARRYKISLSAAALRLIELGLASNSLYGEVMAVIRSRRTSSSSQRGGSERRVPKRVRQYGRRASATLIEAVNAGGLSERDVADMLRVDFQELSEIGRAVGVVTGAA